MGARPPVRDLRRWSLPRVRAAAEAVVGRTAGAADAIVPLTLTQHTHTHSLSLGSGTSNGGGFDTLKMRQEYDVNSTRPTPCNKYPPCSNSQCRGGGLLCCVRVSIFSQCQLGQGQSPWHGPMSHELASFSWQHLHHLVLPLHSIGVGRTSWYCTQDASSLSPLSLFLALRVPFDGTRTAHHRGSYSSK
jgi:hypothetical protein